MPNGIETAGTGSQQQATMPTRTTTPINKDPRQHNEQENAMRMQRSGVAVNTSIDAFRKKGSKPYVEVPLDGGKIIGTQMGGDLKLIGYKFVNAGERIKVWDCLTQIRVLAPKVPTTDQIEYCIKAGFVPMTYMIQDYDKRKSNKKTIERRVMDSAMPTVTFDSQAPSTSPWAGAYYQDTYAWKTKVMSSLLPNYCSHTKPFSVLPNRAYSAFRNAYCINKIYQPKVAEFTEPVVTQTEKEMIVGSWDANGEPYMNTGNGATQKDVIKDNYYTEIKLDSIASGEMTQTMPTNITGQQYSDTNGVVNQGVEWWRDANREQSSVVQHLNWQNQVAEWKRRTDQALMNDWDIIAEMGGCASVKTDRPQLLGMKLIKLNYQQITQSAPANGNDSTDLGTTGAYSVTQTENTLFGFKEFLQDGVIVITGSVISDNTYEESVHRTLMIKDTTEMFNTEIAKVQDDVLEAHEINGTVEQTPYGIAFKRKYTEWATVPNLCIGDMRSLQLRLTPTSYQANMSEWHNFKSTGLKPTLQIDATYFQDKTQELIARNSLINGFATSLTTAPTYPNNWNASVPDQIAIAGQHRVVAYLQPLSSAKVYGVESIQ